MASQTSGPQEVEISAPAAAYPAVRNWLRKLDLEATTAAEEDNSDVIMQIVNGILAAETEEELFKAQAAGVLATKNFVNMPFRLTSDGVMWRRSAFENAALPFFAMMKITDLADGEEKMLAGGGVTFMTVLSKLIDFGSLDRAEDNGEGRPLQIINKKTASGYDVLMLAPVNLSGSKPKNGTKN